VNNGDPKSRRLFLDAEGAMMFRLTVPAEVFQRMGTSQQLDDTHHSVAGAISAWVLIDRDRMARAWWIFRIMSSWVFQMLSSMLCVRVAITIAAPWLNPSQMAPIQKGHPKQAALSKPRLPVTINTIATRLNSISHLISLYYYSHTILSPLQVNAAGAS
jgi:hypothetical protein